MICCLGNGYNLLILMVAIAANFALGDEPQLFRFEDLTTLNPKPWINDVFEKQWAYIPSQPWDSQKFVLPMNSTAELMSLLETSCAP